MAIRITRARIVISVLSLALVASTGTAVWAASQARTPAQAAAEAQTPEPSVITASVQEGPLADERTFTGELAREVSQDVTAPAAGEGESGGAIVTHLPLKSGDEVRHGRPVVEISGRPVIAFTGEFPAFRDVKEGDEGRDVKQLQEALRKLYGTPVTGEFDARTAADVRKLYSGLGYQVPTVDGTAETDPETGEAAETPKLVGVPAAELLYVKALPSTIGKVNAEVGLPATGTLLTLVGGDWQVVVPLTDGPQGLDDLAEEARLSFGDGPLEDKKTSLIDIGPPPAKEQSEDEGENEGDYFGEQEQETDLARFTVKDKDLPDKPKVGDEQEVVVEFQHSPEDAVVVPASALWRTTAGDVVTVVDTAGNRTDVPVTVHLNHEGLVAVSPKDGGALPVGAKVVVADRSGTK